MNIPEAVKLLQDHNIWRRGEDETMKMQHPTEIGIAIDTVCEVLSQKPKKLIQDNDCHWYLIPHDEEDNFWKWVEAMENDGDTDLEYEQYGIDSPNDILIFKL